MSERKSQGSESRRFFPLVFLAPALLFLMGFDDADGSDEGVPPKPVLREGPALYPEEPEPSVQNPATCTHEYYFVERNFFSGYITKVCVRCLTVLEKVYEA